MEQQQTSPRKLTAAQRRALAVKLRLAGLTYEQIAEQVGVTRQRAHQIIKQVLAEAVKEAKGAGERLRRLQVMRAEAIIASNWTRRGQPRTADSLLRAMAEIDRLEGLEAPQRFEDVTNPIDRANDVRERLHRRFAPQPASGAGAGSDR